MGSQMIKMKFRFSLSKKKRSSKDSRKSGQSRNSNLSMVNAFHPDMVQGFGVIEDIPLNQKIKTNDYQSWMLEDVIKSKAKIFRAYLQAFEPSGIKNLDFCLAVDEFRTNFFNPTYDSLAEAEKIYSKYLRPLNPG